MPPEPDSCIFCGRAGERLTREDAWPKWISEVVGQKGKHTVSVTHAFGVTKRKKKVGLILKLRVVCQRCNNEWMSAMEKRTKATLTPMISGASLLDENLHGHKRKVPLDTKDQILVSTWAVKTVMVMEFIEDLIPPLAVPEHRQVLMETNQPPEGYTVWIAGHRGGDAPWTSYRPFTLTLHPHNPAIEDLSFYVSTIQIGYLVLQVVGPSGTPTPDQLLAMRTVKGPHGFENHVLRVWPPSVLTLLWPPPILDAKALEALAEFGKPMP